MTIWAAARRTLMTWRQPTAHCCVTKKKNKTSSVLMHSLRLHISVRIYLLLLATLLSKPSRNSERSASVAIPVFPYPAQTFDHAVELRSVAIHPSQCSLESIVHKCSNWGAIRLRPSAKRIPQNFQCLFMVWQSKCFVPKSAQLSFPPTRVILMSPLIDDAEWKLDGSRCASRTSSTRLTCGRGSLFFRDPSKLLRHTITQRVGCCHQCHLTRASRYLRNSPTGTNLISMK